MTGPSVARSTPRIAIVRTPGPSLAGAIRTHVETVPVDVAQARRQHEAYVETLASLGCEIVRLPELPGSPDAVFVEDTVVVLEDVAVACRPGAAARRAEVPSVIEAVARYREVVSIEPPATVDGGDLLALGGRLYVGRSSRTNGEGVCQLAALLEPRGYEVVPVAVRGCLHLKTAATMIGDRTVLAHRPWIESSVLADVRIVDVDPAEPFAANVLRIGDTVLVARRFPRTMVRLLDEGFDVRTVAADELAKAEGGLTCASVVLEAGH